MEEASVMMVGLRPERIMQGLIQIDSQKIGSERTLRQVEDYSMPNVSDKMVRTSQTQDCIVDINYFEKLESLSNKKDEEVKVVVSYVLTEATISLSNQF